MKNEKYVIVDTRTCCGNSILFWGWDHSGKDGEVIIESWSKDE